MSEQDLPTISQLNVPILPGRLLEDLRLMIDQTKQTIASTVNAFHSKVNFPKSLLVEEAARTVLRVRSVRCVRKWLCFGKFLEKAQVSILPLSYQRNVIADKAIIKFGEGGVNIKSGKENQCSKNYAAPKPEPTVLDHADNLPWPMDDASIPIVPKVHFQWCKNAHAGKSR